MAKKKKQDTFVEELEKTVKILKDELADIHALMNGETPPSVLSWEKHIQEHWNDYTFIAYGGHVYKLTDKVKQKDNGAYYSPCDLCELKHGCKKDDRAICHELGAASNEYFYDAGELVIEKKNMKIKPWFPE